MNEGNTRLYHIWTMMKQRCHNPNNAQYKQYGSRGIAVCENWRNSFKDFKEWALVNGYMNHLTLDRIDNNKGYTPDNCRWATRKQQANNRRYCHFIEYNGQVKSLSEWAECAGITTAAFYARLQNKWPLEKILNTPVIRRWNK